MFDKPTLADLRRTAQQLGMNPSDAYLEAALRITGPLAAAYAALDAAPDELPPVKIRAMAAIVRARRRILMALGT